MLSTIVVYFKNPSALDFHLNPFTDGFYYIHILWIIFFIESLTQIIPRKNIVVGCGKQFSINYKANFKDIDELEFYRNIRIMNIQAIKVFIIWSVGNLFISLFYIFDYIGEKEMLLLSLLYFLGDLICVLFYCPFQRIIMKNRCCSVCRIYSWDHIMMFTPFIFIKSFFTWSLVSLGIIIFLKWEYAYLVYPERFQEESNILLSCRYCQDKICKIRKPLYNKSDSKESNKIFY